MPGIFKCDLQSCNYSSNFASNLSSHKRTHLNKERAPRHALFTCKKCTFCGNSSGSLQKHTKRMHDETVKNDTYIFCKIEIVLGSHCLLCGKLRAKENTTLSFVLNKAKLVAQVVHNTELHHNNTTCHQERNRIRPTRVRRAKGSLNKTNEKHVPCAVRVGSVLVRGACARRTDAPRHPGLESPGDIDNDARNTRSTAMYP